MVGWFVTGLSKLFALEDIPRHLTSSGDSETLPLLPLRIERGFNASVTQTPRDSTPFRDRIESGLIFLKFHFLWTIRTKPRGTEIYVLGPSTF
jgi:hypothetical protein